MRVRKSAGTKPVYPSKRHFLAALGAGVIAAAAQADPPPLAGVPMPPKRETNVEARLLGDIAVVPTNRCPTVPPASTNAPPKLRGEMPAVPRTPGKPASPAR